MKSIQVKSTEIREVGKEDEITLRSKTHNLIGAGEYFSQDTPSYTHTEYIQDPADVP